MAPSKEGDSAADFNLAAIQEHDHTEDVIENETACTNLLSTSEYEVASIQQRYGYLYGSPCYTESSKSESDDVHVCDDDDLVRGANNKAPSESNGSISEDEDSQAGNRRIEIDRLYSLEADELTQSSPRCLWSDNTQFDMMHTTDSGTSFDAIPELIFQLQDADDLVVKIHWELFEFCKDELDGEPDLSSVLVACGTASRSYSSTCSDYVSRLWPKHGTLILDFIIVFLSAGSIRGTSTTQPFPLAVHREKTYTLLTAKCAKTESIALLQQLMFLSAVLRPGKEGPPQISNCDLAMEHGHLVITLQELCPIPDLEWSCWHRIYQGGVIAHRFPIPRRENEIGIELPFDLMISLTDTWYPVEYKDGMILKGRTMALIPSAMSSDTVQWHLVTSNGPDLELALDELHKYPVSVIPLSEFSIACQKRTVLGYCSSARIWLGTRGSGYQHIRLSTAPPYKGSRFSLSRDMNLALGFAQGGTGSVTLKFRLPKTMRKIKSERPNISDSILQSRHNPALLYSVDEGIAYLVPELCVVMHLILHWAWHQHDRKELLRKLPRTQLSSDGGLAAFETIDRYKELELRSASQIGGQVTLLGLVERFLQSLQGLKELLYSEEYVTIDRSSRIVGWEFVDIALSQHFQAAKKSEIQVPTAGDWPKALSKDPRIVNIFASHLEHPIRPDPSTKLCRTWMPLPSHKDFLVASVACVSVLTERLGHDLHRPALNVNFNLTIPLGSCMPCDPADVNGCRRIASLTQKSEFSGQVPPLTGAVIIGSHKRQRTATCVVEADPSSMRTTIYSEYNSSSESENENLCVPPDNMNLVPHESQPCTAYQLDEYKGSDALATPITSQEVRPATMERIIERLSPLVDGSPRQAINVDEPQRVERTPEHVIKTLVAALPFAKQSGPEQGNWIEIVDDDAATKEGISYINIGSREIKQTSNVGQIQPHPDRMLRDLKPEPSSQVPALLSSNRMVLEEKYLKCTAKVKAYGEQLADIDYEYWDSIAARDLLQEQGEVLSVSDEDFEADYQQNREAVSRALDKASAKADRLNAKRDAAKFGLNATRRTPSDLENATCSETESDQHTAGTCSTSASHVGSVVAENSERLENYYAAAAHMRNLRERFWDLQAEQQEQQMHRELLEDQDQAPEPSDKEFRNAWDRVLEVAHLDYERALEALEVAKNATRPGEIPSWARESNAAQSTDGIGEPESQHRVGRVADSLDLDTVAVSPGQHNGTYERMSKWMSDVASGAKVSARDNCDHGKITHCMSDPDLRARVDFPPVTSASIG